MNYYKVSKFYKLFSMLKLRYFIILNFFIIFFDLLFFRNFDYIYKEIITTYTFYFSNLLLFYIFMKKTGISLKEIIGEKIIYLNYLIYIKIFLLLFIFSLGSIYFIQGLLAYINPNFFQDFFINEHIFISNGNSKNSIYNILISINIVLIAPIAEEIFFKVYLLHRFAIKFNKNISIILLSILFAIFHIDILGSFVFCLITTIIYFQTKSILIPIYLHLLNNGIAVLLSLILPNTSSEIHNVEYYTEIAKNNLPTGLLILFISGIWVIKYIKKYWPTSENIPLFY